MEAQRLREGETGGKCWDVQAELSLPDVLEMVMDFFTGLCSSGPERSVIFTHGSYLHMSHSCFCPLWNVPTTNV